MGAGEFPGYLRVINDRTDKASVGTRVLPEDDKCWRNDLRASGITIAH
jgi:hypothetical protein